MASLKLADALAVRGLRKRYDDNEVVAALLTLAVGAFYIATVLTRRRLLK